MLNRNAMSHRAEIQELAMNVGQGLTAYVAVHDAIFRNAATLKSLVKNLVGRGVPISKLVADAEALLPFWVTMQDRLEGFREASYTGLSENERQYFDLLARYVDALGKT